MTEKKGMKIFKAAMRFVVFTAAFCLVSYILQVSFAKAIEEGSKFYDEAFKIANIVHFIFLSIAFYSLDRTVSVSSDIPFEQFGIAKLRKGIFPKLSFIFGNLQFWLECAAFFILCLFLPLNVFFAPVYNIFAGDGAVFPEKITVLSALLPIVFVINLFAKMTVIKKWGRHEQEKALGIYKEKHSLEFRVVKNFIIKTVVLSLCGFLITIFIPWAVKNKESVKSFFSSVFFIIFVVLIICIIAVRYIILLIKRRKFISSLKKKSQENGWTLSEIKHKYSSIFRFFEGGNFELAANGKTYSCKFLGTLHRKTPMIIFDNGTFMTEQIFTMFHVEFFRRIKNSGIFAYKSDNVRIIILDPVSNDVSTRDNGKKIVIDNGDKVGDYRFFTPNAFINAAERDCLDRKEKKFYE